MNEPESDAAFGAARTEDLWASAAVLSGEGDAEGGQPVAWESSADVVYHFPVQIEVIEPLPIDRDLIADRVLDRLTQHIAGR